MRYPSNMNIGGQNIKVELLDQPLYQFHVCPHCRDLFTGQPFRFPVPTGETKTCPACGATDTQPQDNTYVFGQFLVKDNTLKTWHNDDISDVCGTCFVHETIEAIDSIGDLKLNHTQITTLASLLYQAFSSGAVSFGEATSPANKADCQFAMAA